MKRILLGTAVLMVGLFLAARSVVPIATDVFEVRLHGVPVYAYPSPTDWSRSPYPAGRAAPQPQVSVSCPAWAPTLVKHANGTYECKANVPPPAYIVNPCPDPSWVVKAEEDGTQYCAPRTP